MTARTTMADLISDLRQMTNAGTADFTLGSDTYFSDTHLQTVLDKHTEPFTYELMESEKPAVLPGGTFSWTVYEIEDRENIEATSGGTAIFTIQDQTGAYQSGYSVDYRLGVVTFNADTQGKPYYASGISYDLNAAAADVWEKKANSVSASFDFSTDNHSVKLSQVYATYMKQAAYYRGLSRKAGGHGTMTREDTD